MSTFTARYRGTCENCGDDVEKGQEAAYVGDGIAHVPMCPVDVTSNLRPNKVCPTCFIELPLTGVCEECE